MRILLVTSLTVTTGAISEAFAPAMAAIDVAADVEDALVLAAIRDPDLIVLDRAASDSDGLAMLRRIRASGVVTPLLWLCGDAPADALCRAFDLGADDCVGPLVQPAELLARARALVRRAAGHAAAAIDVSGLVVDIAARTVALDDRALRITGKEFALLELLALRRGVVVGRETIMDHLYGGPQEPVAKVIDIHICRIRRKLAAVAPGRVLLRTVWGQGFVLGERAPAAHVQPMAA